MRKSVLPFALLLYACSTRLFTLLAIITFLQSCGADSTEPVNPYDYYPLETGQFRIYDVKEESYSSGNKEPVVRSWQEKDEIATFTTNGENTSTYIVSRYTRNLPTDFWLKIKEYSVQKSPDKILTTLDNQTVFSLIFPVDNRIKWNGNAYNNLDAEDYHYESISQAVVSGTLSFNNTLTVVERNDTTSVIDRFVGKKQYALGVGLITDEQTSFAYCQSTPDCIGLGIVESGTHKIRKLIEFGSSK